MWNHLFTLQALAREFNALLENLEIAEVFSQEKNQLIVSFEARGTSASSLMVSVDPAFNYTMVRDRVSRARRNSADLFPEIVGGVITHVHGHDAERVVFFSLSNGLTLYVQLFGTAESNVLLLDHDRVVLHAFKKNKDLAGSTLNLREKTSFGDALVDVESFSSRLLSSDSPTTYAALKSAIPFLGSTYAREILHRAGVPEQDPPSQLNPKDLEGLLSSTQSILRQAQQPSPTVYFRSTEPRVFSVVPLLHLSGAETKKFPSVNDAIRSTAFRSSRTRPVESTKNNLIRKLKSEHSRVQRSMRAQQQELAATARADHYERIANIVMANLQHLTKGTRALDLEDIFSEKKALVRIEFNPALSPSANAELYYAKAKKARSARAETERRHNQLKTQLAQVEKLLLHLDQCQTEEEVKEFMREHAPTLQSWNLVPKKNYAERPPFRVFTTAGGFEIWVGKNSTNNDLLTLKYAKPHDLWFHARGAGGSHVVLRVAGKKPPKEALVQAARIAAYYSKMRKASTVPVAYTERKYVRKPKGAEPGAVILEREKVIFVEPGLPP